MGEGLGVRLRSRAAGEIYSQELTKGGPAIAGKQIQLASMGMMRKSLIR
jgi:hypothetical protein